MAPTPSNLVQRPLWAVGPRHVPAPGKPSQAAPMLWSVNSAHRPFGSVHTSGKISIGLMPAAKSRDPAAARTGQAKAGPGIRKVNRPSRHCRHHDHMMVIVIIVSLQLSLAQTAAIHMLMNDRLIVMGSSGTQNIPVPSPVDDFVWGKQRAEDQLLHTRQWRHGGESNPIQSNEF